MPDRAFHTERTLRRRDGGLIGGEASTEWEPSKAGPIRRGGAGALLRFRLAEAECGGLCGDESPLTLWRSSTPLIRSKEPNISAENRCAAVGSRAGTSSRVPPPRGSGVLRTSEIGDNDMKTPTTLIIMDGFGLEGPPRATRWSTPHPKSGPDLPDFPWLLTSSASDWMWPAGGPDGQQRGGPHQHGASAGWSFRTCSHISRDIESGEFFKNPAYLDAMSNCREGLRPSSDGPVV